MNFDTLVILMVALGILAVALFITAFVLFRKNKTEYSDKKELEKIEEDDEEEINSFETVDMNVFSSDNSYDNITNNVHNNNIEKENVSNSLVQNNNIVPSSNTFQDTTISVINPTVALSDNLSDVVNILINNKNYIFLANNNIVNKGEHLDIILNDKIYHGVVTKSNYKRDVQDLRIKPKKLNIKK